MKEILNIIHKTIYQFFDACEDDEEVPMSDKDKLLLEVNKAICNNLKAFNVPDTNAGELISRQAALGLKIIAPIAPVMNGEAVHYEEVVFVHDLEKLPSVEPGQCKRCKYFEYDSVAKVDGIPLIVAHEICKRWGDGCKTREDGYCFLYEPQEMEVDG